MKSNFSKTVIFISLFIPIIAAASYERVDPKVINCAIVLSIIIGLFFLIFILRIQTANKYAFFLAVFMYGFAWFSNLEQYIEIVLFVSYALLVHLIGYNFPRLLYKQYLAVCYLIVIITIVDLLSFSTLGSVIIGRTDIRPVSELIPRISGFFDEPTHQAIFLGPALFYFLPNILSGNKAITKSNQISGIFILMAYLFTFSVTGYFMLVCFIVYLVIKKRKISLLGLVIMLAVIYGVVGFGEKKIVHMLMHKLQSVFDKNMYYGNN